MKIIVFGASGGTGIEIVKQALDADHIVTAFVRDPAKLNFQHPDLIVVQGDVLDADAVLEAVTGHDAVISALGPTRPPVAHVMETAAQNIVAAMKKASIRRLITTTGAGVRDPKDQPKFVDHFIRALLALLAHDVLKDSIANVEVIRASGLDWTVVRFPRLINGSMTGKYRVGYVGKDSGTQISRADGAHFVLNELVEGKYIHQMPVVSY